MENESVVVELQHPIEYEGTTISKITLKNRIKLKHLIDIGEHEFVLGTAGQSPKSLIVLVSACTGIGKEVVGEIDFVDLENIGEQMEPFLS